MRTSTASAVVCLLAGALLVPQADAGARTTKKARLQVWTSNLHMMAHNGDPTIWKKLVHRMAAHRLLPDVLALNEMCNGDVGGARGNDARQFVHYLEKTTGANYAFRHGATGAGPCWAADTMVAWRTPRLSLAGVTRWRSVADAPGDGDSRCTRREGPSITQLGVVLRDRLQGKALVAAAVHFPVGGTRRCINENASVLHRVLERARSTRRLTIVGGDFNQLPQRDGPASGDELAAGTQVDPDCWYRSLSMLTARDRQACARESRSFAAYHPRSDTYVDAVHAAHQGTASGTGSPAICDEWTHSRAFASEGTSCTDVSGSDDRPDGLSDRGRIDYVWARWELGDGRARSFTSDEAADLVGRAGADKVRPPRYSDHRAVRALLYWCLPGERCRR